MKAQMLIKMVMLSVPIDSDNPPSSVTLHLFDCQIEAIFEEKIVMVGVLYNPNMSNRSSHLLRFWMKHMLCQLESEFTSRVLREDFPDSEITQPAKFVYYQ